MSLFSRASALETTLLDSPQVTDLNPSGQALQAPGVFIMSDRLDGKIALITCATQGIGLATAKLFAAQGAHVYITGRDAEALKTAHNAIGANVTYIQADSTRIADP